MESKYKVHTFYVILILVSIIIGLISVEWSKVPSLVDYITFALTLSSLILAGLAIVYSIYSNTSLSSSLAQISNAATDVQGASKQISESNDRLKAEVEKLPLRLDQVDKNITNTHKVLKEFSLSRERDSIPDTLNENEAKKINEDIVVNFMKTSSLTGIQALFIVELSYRTKTSFSFKEIINSIPDSPDNIDYWQAYIVATSCFELISYQSDAQNRISINYIHPTISSQIEKLTKQKVINRTLIKDDDSADEKHKKITSRLKALNLIANFFGREVSTEYKI